MRTGWQGVGWHSRGCASARSPGQSTHVYRRADEQEVCHVLVGHLVLHDAHLQMGDLVPFDVEVF